MINTRISMARFLALLVAFALLNMALPDSAHYGWNTVLVDDVPQESDVFLTLTRSPHRPELVATAHYDYDIAVDGSITWSVGQRGKKDK